MTQRGMKLGRIMLIATMFGVCAGAGRPAPQQAAGSQQSPQNHDPLTPLGPEIPPSLAAKQEKARNDDRQRRLVADTDKLLALATQLHDEVGKTDKNVLSIEVIKKSEEIEKLAHAVKERMRG